MRSRIYKLGALLVILLLAVGGCRKAGVWLVRSDHPEHADVMIMLMGSMTDRVPQIADLYRDKVAGKVWIVEAEMGSDDPMDYTAQSVSDLIDLGVPADSIVVLPGDATSTRMEAEICREYLLTQTGMDTLLLVTSSYHTRRAHKIFRAACLSYENPVVLYCCPSSYTTFHPHRWWRQRSDIKKVVTEYLKLLNFYLFERGALRGTN